MWRDGWVTTSSSSSIISQPSLASLTLSYLPSLSKKMNQSNYNSGYTECWGNLAHKLVNCECCTTSKPICSDSLYLYDTALPYHRRCHTISISIIIIITKAKLVSFPVHVVQYNNWFFSQPFNFVWGNEYTSHQINSVQECSRLLPSTFHNVTASLSYFNYFITVLKLTMKTHSTVHEAI